MSLSNWSRVMVASPTLATSPGPRLAPPPPHPAAASAMSAAGTVKSRKRLMEKAPSAADASRCLARFEYSSDERDRPPESVSFLVAGLAERDLPLRARVHGGIETPAQLRELVGAEHERADCRPPTAEDQVVGPQPRELQLRVLDREQVLDRLRHGPEAVLRRRVQLSQLVVGLRERDASVEVDLERLGSDVFGGDVCVHARIDPDRARRQAALAGELRDRLRQQLDVELEPDRGHVPGLLGPEEIACPTDLEVAQGDREAGPQLGVVGEGREARACLRRELPAVG